MRRVAFKMKLFKGCGEEYKKRHDELWPRLEELLKQTGISNYSIFLDKETNDLFSCFTIDDIQKLDELPGKSLMKEWWDQMIDIMETNEDHSPVSISLHEVFYLP